MGSVLFTWRVSSRRALPGLSAVKASRSRLVSGHSFASPSQFSCPLDVETCIGTVAPPLVHWSILWAGCFSHGASVLAELSQARQRSRLVSGQDM